MTEPARIRQDDMTRACKAVAEAGFARARIVMDLENRRIDIIVGESEDSSLPPANPLDRLLQNGP